MADVTIKLEKLSIPAHQTLNIVDRYADLIESRTGKKIKNLSLHWQCYDDLDKSIRYQTGGEESLKEMTYRGIEIIRDDTSWDE